MYYQLVNDNSEDEEKRWKLMQNVMYCFTITLVFNDLCIMFDFLYYFVTHCYNNYYLKKTKIKNI